MFNFRLNHIQIVLFLEKEITLPLLDILKVFIKNDIYKGEPVFLPKFEKIKDSTPSLPILEVKEVNNLKKIIFWQKQIALEWRAESPESDTWIIESVEEVVKTVTLMKEILSNEKIKRIGVITEHLFVIGTQNDSNIMDNFSDSIIKISDTEGIFGIDLKATIKTNSRAYDNCNFLVQIQNGHLNNDTEPKRDVLILKQDFNTHQDKNIEFDVDKACMFIKEGLEINFGLRGQEIIWPN